MARSTPDQQSLESKESRILPRLSRQDQESYLNLRQGVAEVRQKNPDLDTRVNTRLLSEYLDAALRHRQEMDAYRNKAKNNGIIPDPGAIQHLSTKRHNEFLSHFHRNVLPSYGEEGKQAYAMLMDARRSESIPEAVAGQFYKSEKGGARWGGIIGGLAAGLFVFTQMGGMAGGLLGFGVTAIAAIAGAWLTNRGVDKISEFVQSREQQKQNTPDTREPARNTDHLVERQRQQQKPVEMTQLVKPEDLALAAAEIDPRDTLIPPQTPVSPDKKLHQRV
ncbi:MAG: hypothetical protein SFW63_01385 [Alphaproteobacteria bacterium]|nr:hypothetical protein [Alphaproteobacteria bacterium]